ncbi:hypothetical protein DERP_008159, partial [Dermatophagoides pteronyssinus]
IILGERLNHKKNSIQILYNIITNGIFLTLINYAANHDDVYDKKYLTGSFWSKTCPTNVVHSINTIQRPEYKIFKTLSNLSFVFCV